MKKTILTMALLVAVSAAFADAFYSPAMLQGRYNFVSFGCDHGTEFSSGIGYIDFDGVSAFTGRMEQVTHSQMIGDAFEVGPLSGTYTISDYGKVQLNGMDTGFISADGTIVVLSPVPGDVVYEETGLTVAVKQGTGMSAATLDGTYGWVSFQCENTTCFESEYGTVTFDGVSRVSGTSHAMMYCKAGGVYEESGRFSGDYAVASNGKLTSLDGSFTGFVSPDGSLFVFAPVTDAVHYEETGITIGVRQAAGLSARSVQTQYNAVVFGSDHAAEFSAGTGTVTFDGRSDYESILTAVSHSQSPGTAFETGTADGDYRLSKKGELNLDRMSTGFVSADASVVLWVPLPGDKPYEEGGLTVGLRQVSHRVGNLDISRATVSAGSKNNADSIQLLGQMDATEPELLTADAVIVNVTAGDVPDPNLTTWALPVDDTTFTNGRYNGTVKDGSAQFSFRYDPKNGRMQFSAKNVDLTGLACPMTVTITIGAYTAQVDLDEDTVNGTRKPCPPELMMGVADSLTVDKARVRFGRTAGTDTLTVQGFFTIAGDYDKAKDLIANLGVNRFTVSGDQFNARGAAETCNNGTCDEGPKMKASFDFVKCTYSITITGMTVEDYGPVSFGIDVFGNLLNGAIVDLGPKQTYSFWELTHCDQPNVMWDYNARAGRDRYPVDRWTEAGYIVFEEQLGAGVQLYFQEDAEATHLTRYYYWDTDGGKEASMDTSGFDLLFWPASLRLGQSHSDESLFDGFFEFSDYIGVDFDWQGTVGCKVTLGTRPKPIRYKNQSYQAIPFTDVMAISGDLYYADEDVGELTIKLTTRNYAVPGIGIVEMNRSGTLNLRIPGAGSLRQPIRENAELEDTTLD